MEETVTETSQVSTDPGDQDFFSQTQQPQELSLTQKVLDFYDSNDLFLKTQESQFYQSNESQDVLSNTQQSLYTSCLAAPADIEDIETSHL